MSSRKLKAGTMGLRSMSDAGLTVLGKLRKVADYQFGRGAGENLFPGNITVVFSKRTGQIRHIYLEGKLLATLRPRDGLLSLAIDGAKRLMEGVIVTRAWVQVQEDAVDFVKKGGDLFARHVVDVGEELRPGEEVVVLDKNKRVIAVGRTMLSGDEMKEFKRGVAVRVRRGSLEKPKKHERNDSR